MTQVFVQEYEFIFKMDIGGAQSLVRFGFQGLSQTVQDNLEVFLRCVRSAFGPKVFDDDFF